MAAPVASPLAAARMPAAAQLATSRIFGADRKKAVAQEFEAVFLSNMLEEMFAGLAEEGPMGAGAGTGTWRSFLTDQYAKTITANGGVGLADQVHRQLIALQERNK